MDLAHSRELLHRINLLYSRRVISVENRIWLHEMLVDGRVCAQALASHSEHRELEHGDVSDEISSARMDRKDAAPNTPHEVFR